MAEIYKIHYNYRTDSDGGVDWDEISIEGFLTDSEKKTLYNHTSETLGGVLFKIGNEIKKIQLKLDKVNKEDGHDEIDWGYHWSGLVNRQRESEGCIYPFRNEIMIYDFSFNYDTLDAAKKVAEETLTSLEDKDRQERIKIEESFKGGQHFCDVTYKGKQGNRIFNINKIIYYDNPPTI